MISIYDIEVFPNFFCCTFKEIHTGDVKSFCVGPGGVNEWALFQEYYMAHEGLIGYNNVDYDDRVLSPFINSGELSILNGPAAAHLLYERSQDVIAEDFDEKRTVPLVPQRDLYKLWHFNNKARMVSLKYLQFNMGWRDMQDSPFDWTHMVEEKDVPLILEYNRNDVNSTFEFYKRSVDKIRLRKKLGEMYDTNMGNYSDNKIGETIFLKELSKRTGRSEKAIANGRTPRANIPVRDCLVPGIAFETKPFQDILERYLQKTITKTKLTPAEKKKQKMFAILDGVKYEFGMGGLHALRAPGIYYDKRSADVSSYYPNLAIGQKLYPQHLGLSFCDVYNQIYQWKTTTRKGTDENTAYKAALVCVFGSSNAQWSPFYDPKYTMSITINGQLILAMLCERITTSGAGHIIMANTDGIEVDVVDNDLFLKVCAEWQENFKLLLEYNTYKQIAIRDVNAYHAIDIKGKVKVKGDLEIEKDIWKDSSMRIVPIAVDTYFRNKVPVEHTIMGCQDIGMFCIGKRAKTGKLEYRSTDKNTGALVKQKLPKNVRYFISRSGGSIVKVTKSTDKQKKKKIQVVENQVDMFSTSKAKVAKVDEEQRVTAIHQGYRMTMFNQWVDKPFAEYDVEKQFYIREANKLIDSIVKNQTTF